MYRRLQASLDYEFDDTALLGQALTHRSAAAINNERLEFLGDAVLGFVVAEALFRAYPDASEADLTIMRASLVKKDTLASVARAIQLGEHLELGSGERKNGGRDRSSILADALEAVIGAVIVDGTDADARRVILTLFNDRIDQLGGRSEKDSKTKLQEILQKGGMVLPSYRVVRTEGEAHAQTYFVECVVEELSVRAEASASSRRSAEKLAAQYVIAALDDSRLKGTIDE